jgi:hypothetical protein
MMRAITIFCLFIFGLVVIVNASDRFEHPYDFIILFTGIGILLYILNRFWKARTDV